MGALIVASQIARGERDVGSFVAYSAYMLQLLDEISQLGELYCASAYIRTGAVT